MALAVIKRSGAKEYFDPDKMKKSIENASESVKLSKERKEKLIERVYKPVLEEIKDKEEVETKEIRDRILQKLDELEPKVAKAWRRYETEVKGLILEEEKEE